MKKQPGRVSRGATAAFSAAALGLALAALIPAAPAPAHVAPSNAVTSSDFPVDGPFDFSATIRKSCRDFTAGSDGVVKAHCFWKSGNTWGVRDTTIDLDEKMSNDNGSLAWKYKNRKNFSDTCKDIEAALDSNNKHILLKANCLTAGTGNYIADTWEMKNGLKNENGYLKFK